LLLVALAVFHGLRTDRQAGVEAALQAVAELKIGQLETWLNERSADVAFFGSDSQLASDFERWLSTDGQDGAALAQSQARLAAMKRNEGYDTIALFDDAGYERFRSEGIASQAEFGPQASAAMRQDQPQLVDFHRQPGEPIRIGMVGPIKRIAAQGTHIVGAIYLGAPAQRQVFPLLLRWPLPSQTGETVLARPEDESILNIVTRKTPPMTIRVPIDQPGLLSARAARNESGILRGARDYAGDPVLGYAARVPGTPWILVAKQDTREVDAPLRQWALWVALVTLLLLGGTGGVNWFWWRAQSSRWRARVLQQALDQAVATQQATAALFASNEVNRVTFEQAAIGIAHVGVDGRWLRVNHKLCEILGYPIEELPRIALQDIAHPQDLESDTEAMHKLLGGAASRFGGAALCPQGLLAGLDQPDHLAGAGPRRPAAAFHLSGRGYRGAQGVGGGTQCLSDSPRSRRGTPDPGAGNRQRGPGELQLLDLSRPARTAARHRRFQRHLARRLCAPTGCGRSAPVRRGQRQRA
jgi:PAS domain-containing protein